MINNKEVVIKSSKRPDHPKSSKKHQTYPNIITHHSKPRGLHIIYIKLGWKNTNFPPPNKIDKQY